MQKYFKYFLFRMCLGYVQYIFNRYLSNESILSDSLCIYFQFFVVNFHGHIGCSVKEVDIINELFRVYQYIWDTLDNKLYVCEYVTIYNE